MNNDTVASNHDLIDFAELGQRLGLPPLAAVCAAVVNGYPLIGDRFQAHLVAALAKRCGVTPFDAPVPVSRAGVRPVPSPDEDPSTRRRVLRILLRQMLLQQAWYPALIDKHEIIRGLPSHERGMGKVGVELLIKAGLVQPANAPAQSSIGMVPQARAAIEAATQQARFEDPGVLAWLGEGC
ncbi:MAG: hypothetical protein ACYCYK_06645 [Candidatus Dormibacteria bacterium]